MKRQVFHGIIALLVSASAHAQVNSGSNGSDGAFNPATNIVIDMADHPTGVYQYTSVSIPSGVTVTFTPNANNSPVVWLVQSNCVVSGTVDVSGQNGTTIYGSPTGGPGGPGGYRGGTGGIQATSGQGPGGGASGAYGANASYGRLGNQGIPQMPPPAPTYGNTFLVPLLGGSGGGGSTGVGVDGGGGGGVMLIAASNGLAVNGAILANGGYSYAMTQDAGAGCGSGGAIRFVASQISGAGQVSAEAGNSGGSRSGGGSGRVRFDTYTSNFGGNIQGVFTQGSQFVIIPSAGQLPQLTVTSVGGVPVAASPTGVLSAPDVVLSAQQNNPIPIVVHCSNLPLNTQITVSVKPAAGAGVSATGYNTGTLASSTATVSIVIPRGGGLIYTTAATN